MGQCEFSNLFDDCCNNHNIHFTDMYSRARWKRENDKCWFAAIVWSKVNYCDSKASFFEKNTIFQFIDNKMEKSPIRMKKTRINWRWVLKWKSIQNLSGEDLVLSFYLTFLFYYFMCVCIKFVFFLSPFSLSLCSLLFWIGNLKGLSNSEIEKHDLKHTYGIVCYSILYFDFGTL